MKRKPSRPAKTSKRPAAKKAGKGTSARPAATSTTASKSRRTGATNEPIEPSHAHSLTSGERIEPGRKPNCRTSGATFLSSR